MGRVFSRAVAIVSIAVRACIYCAESLFELEVVLGAINSAAGYVLLGLRVTLCVSSSRLGMLDYKTLWPLQDCELPSFLMGVFGYALEAYN